MIAGKKNSTDRHFMPNLEAAIKAEARKAATVPRKPVASAATTTRAGVAPKKATAKGGSAKETARSQKGAVAPAAKKPRGKTATASAVDRGGAHRGAAQRGAAQRDALLKELRSMLPKLDTEGLDFLLEQAKTHFYNMEVERANEAQARRSTRQSGKAEAGSASSSALAVERSESGSSYFVRASGDSIMFTAEEMLSLVRIAHGHEDKIGAARAIGAWLQKERRDVLESLKLPGSSRPALPELAALLQTSFRKPGGA
ncbi:MAG TPA: hypothetical protein VMV44_11655 [Rectinemataceae bacterium]|nr:hypothetical protein [Rectinemataceae bacterium]